MNKNVKFCFITSRLLLYLLRNVLFAHFRTKMNIFSFMLREYFFPFSPFYISFNRHIKLETKLGKYREQGVFRSSHIPSKGLSFYIAKKKINRITVDISQPRIEPPQRRVCVLTSKAHVSRSIDRCFFPQKDERCL